MDNSAAAAQTWENDVSHCSGVFAALCRDGTKKVSLSRARIGCANRHYLADVADAVVIPARFCSLASTCEGGLARAHTRANIDMQFQKVKLRLSIVSVYHNQAIHEPFAHAA